MARKLRTSERLTFATCRQRWWWAWEEGYRPKVDGPALRFGSLVHAALEQRYPPGTKRGPHPAEVFLELYEEELKTAEKFGFRDEDGTWQEAGKMGEALLTEFVNTYGEDDQWEVLSSEQTFRVRVTPELSYVGTFDGIWRHVDKGDIILKEWKTAAQIWARQLPLDEQGGSYWAYAPPWLRKKGILDKGQNLKGILYTFIRKAMPDDRPKNADGLFLNKDGSVSKKQPSPLFERHMVYRDKFDRDMIRARTIAQFDEMEMIRRGELSVWKSPGRQHCSGCPFLDPCELHETGADYMPLLRGLYEKHDPYAAHEIKEENK